MKYQLGYTFIEVMTITAVSALLIVAMTGIVSNSIHINRNQTNQVRITDDARKQLERTSNVIRSSQNIQQGKQVKNWLVAGDNFSLTLYSNVDSDAAVEQVHYYVDPADPTTIKQGIIKPDGSGAYTGPEQTTDLTHSLRNQMPNQALFYYKDKDGNPLSTPLSAADLPKVVTVGMAWRIDDDPTDTIQPEDISTEVTPRRNDLASPTDVPIQAPLNFAGSNPTNTSIDWSWDDANTQWPSSYNLYDTSTTPPTLITNVPAPTPPAPTPTPSGSPVPTPAPRTITYTETGLNPTTAYTRAVTAVYTNGQSDYSNSATVTTLGPVGTPVPPPNLANCQALSGSSITCNGAEPVPGNGTPPNIQPKDPITNPPTALGQPFPPNNGGSFSWTENGLLPGRNYDRLTTAVDVGGSGAESANSNTVTVSTPCTMGGLVNTSPTPTPNPTIAPTPTPRFTSSSAPCFTIGLSVLHVYRVDPDTETITDVSSQYYWLAAPEGNVNAYVNGGTPSAFYELQVPTGGKYYIWIRHNQLGSPVNGQDECKNLTIPHYTTNTADVPQAIQVGPNNFKLDFFYMPNSSTGTDSNFICKIFENNGVQLLPINPYLKVGSIFSQNAQTGVVTSVGSGYYRAVGGAYTYSGNSFSLVLSGLYYILGFQPNCDRLTMGNPTNPVTVPFNLPSPHFASSFDFWEDQYSSQWTFLDGSRGSYSAPLNCRLLEHVSGAVIRPQPGPQPTVKVNSVKITRYYYQNQFMPWQGWYVDANPPVDVSNQYHWAVAGVVSNAAVGQGPFQLPGIYTNSSGTIPYYLGITSINPLNMMGIGSNSCSVKVTGDMNADFKITMGVIANPWGLLTGYILDCSV